MSPPIFTFYWFFFWTCWVLVELINVILTESSCGLYTERAYLQTLTTVSSAKELLGSCWSLVESFQDLNLSNWVHWNYAFIISFVQNVKFILIYQQSENWNTLKTSKVYHKFFWPKVVSNWLCVVFIPLCALFDILLFYVGMYRYLMESCLRLLVGSCL